MTSQNNAFFVIRRFQKENVSLPIRISIFGHVRAELQSQECGVIGQNLFLKYLNLKSKLELLFFSKMGWNFPEFSGDRAPSYLTVTKSQSGHS